MKSATYCEIPWVGLTLDARGQPQVCCEALGTGGGLNSATHSFDEIRNSPDFRDIRKAMLYSDRIEAGVVKINQISTGLALQAPFGGVKKSSTDSFKEQGVAAVDFYSRIKTVYLDYSA